MEFLEMDLRDEEIFLKECMLIEGNPKKGWVPAYRFLICRVADGVEMGRCDLRVGHDRGTYYAGNIGYEVAEPFRGRHYAARACRLLLLLAARHEMGYVILTCNPDNIPSRKTCEAIGCSLQEIVKLPEDNEMYRRGEREKCIYKLELEG